MTAILRILVAIVFLAAPRAASEPIAAAEWQGAVQAQPGAPHEVGLPASMVLAPEGRPGDSTTPEETSSASSEDRAHEPLATAHLDAPQDASAVTFEGTLSWVSPSYGDRYLALPRPRGTRAEICGPADCVTRVSTDYGPDQRLNPDRIADLSAADWQAVCGVPLAFGLCPGTVTLK